MKISDGDHKLFNDFNFVQNDEKEILGTKSVIMHAERVDKELSFCRIVFSVTSFYSQAPISLVDQTFSNVLFEIHHFWPTQCKCEQKLKKKLINNDYQSIFLTFVYTQIIRLWKFTTKKLMYNPVLFAYSNEPNWIVSKLEISLAPIR